MNKRNNISPNPWVAGRHFGKRGIGMLEVMILIAVMSSLLIAGFMQWRVRSYENTSRLEQVKLTQADAALIAFMAVANRLPCPDTDRDGVEDCGAKAQKGWLPTATLRLAGADAGIHAGQLRYLVQRGLPAIDLASVSDDWRPFEYSSNAASMLDSGYAGAPILTLSDLCARLALGSTTAVGASLASVASATPRLVAFAIAHPGNEDRDGDGDLFDGQNALINASQLEPSDRKAALGLYDDVVLERSMNSVRNALGCELLNRSIDSSALAADAVDAVADMKKGNIADGIKAVTWAAASAVLSGLAAVSTVISIASDAGNAGVDTALCAASLGILVNACSAIGIHASAAALGGGEIALNVGSVAASLVAVGLAGAALGVADTNPATAPQACVPLNNSTAIQFVSDQIQKFEADLVTLNSSRSLVVTAKVNADANRSQKIDRLRAVIRNIPPSPVGSTSPFDGRVDTLVTSASNLQPIQVAYEAAIAQRDNAQESYNNAVTETFRLQNMLDNRTALTVTTRASLAAATQTLATLKLTPGTPAATIAEQETEVIRLQGDLQLLTETVPTGQTPTLVVLIARSTAERDTTATTALTAARSNLTTATSNRNTSLATYSGEYAAFIANSAQYIVTQPSGATTTVSSTLDVIIALSQLFGNGGDTGAAAPNKNSVFTQPETLQRRIDALDARISKTNELLTTLKKQLAELNVPQPIPPECNFTPNPARPFKPGEARSLLIEIDRKGGTR